MKSPRHHAHKSPPARLGLSFILLLSLSGFLAAAVAQQTPIIVRPRLLPDGPVSTTQLVTGRKITQPPIGVVTNVGGMPVNMTFGPSANVAIVTTAGFPEFLTTLNPATGAVVSQVPFGITGSPLNSLFYGLAVKGDGTGAGLVYASQGIGGAIVIYQISRKGQLTNSGVDIPTGITAWTAGVALDNNNNLYAVNRTKGAPLLTSSLDIYDRVSGSSLGSFSFTRTPQLTIFPLALQVLNDGSKAYVSSERDGGVYVINTSNPASPTAGPVPFIATGDHPDSLLLNRDQSLLFVANANSDTISVISTATDKVTKTIQLRPTQIATLPGVSPTDMALSPLENTLYVTLGDMNAVAVISTSNYQVKGYIPVGWYPTSCLVTPNGNRLLVSNGNGSQARYPNPNFNWLNPDTFSNPVPNPGYILNLIQGNVQIISLPISAANLQTYTQQVLANSGIPPAAPGRPGLTSPNAAVPPNPLAGIGLQAGKIQNVIYIVKENRSYDQILGDLKNAQGTPVGNGDASLAMYGWDPTVPGAPRVTPNQHQLALQYACFDNFYCAGGVSSEGWPWSTQGQANEFVVKTSPYINRLPELFYVPNYDFEGQNSGYPTAGFPAKDPNGDNLSPLLYPDGAPSIPDVARAAGGHIWSAVKRKRLSYRDYGFFYSTGDGYLIPDNYPNHADLQPAGSFGVAPANVSDWYFRRFDLDFADSDAPALYGCPPARASYGPSNPFGTPKRTTTSRFMEWNYEFQQILAAKAMPNFMMVRFGRNHTMGTTPSTDKEPVHAPAAMIADNDYAVGQLVQAVRSSSIWNHCAIFIIEDDAQFGPDHVDAHRSPCFVVSPYINTGKVDSTFYNTVSVLKTIELLLGLDPMNQYDAFANPLGFTAGGQSTGLWATTPVNQAAFAATLPPQAVVCEYNPKMSALKPSDYRYRLAVLSSRMNWKTADSIPDQLLNEILWKNAKGPNVPMPPPRFSTPSCIASLVKRHEPDGDD